MRRCNSAADLPDLSNRSRDRSKHRPVATLHGVVFDILVGARDRVALAAGKRGLPSRSSHGAPAFAQVGFGASEGWWTRQPPYEAGFLKGFLGLIKRLTQRVPTKIPTKLPRG
jgi:hypothetical protein